MASYPFDLGTHHRSISTASPEAQLWFDRGLIWTYAFNHEEAVRCFERAVEADPNCAMAYWGIAYAAGPNYNKPWVYFDEADLTATVARTHTATQQALGLLDNATPAERALCQALQQRYQAPQPPEDLSLWDDAYAAAMRSVYHEFGTDLDIAALSAEALMNRTPWQLWDLVRNQPADGADTFEAMSMLERALEDPHSRIHPGVLHMYIHLMEMSPHPEKALRAGDWLRTLVPDAGHLKHMPTHIDVLCGHYQAVVESNAAATVADEKYLAHEGPMNFYTLYRVHNYHFELYGAMFLGQYETALKAADGIVAAFPPELLLVESPPMADYLEGFVPMKLHALIRFGRWPELIDYPLPDDQNLYCFTTAMTHHAKAIAFAAVGRSAAADEQVALFDAAALRVPESRMFQNNTCLDVLKVAEAMMRGEVEYHRGNHAVAFEHLRRAVALEDGLLYGEPWAWMQPTRHALGALLLEQGHLAEAEAVYRADLGLDESLPRACRHPENVWSLHGYHECLERQGKHELATMIKQRLDLALARADLPVQASCACRTVVAA